MFLRGPILWTAPGQAPAGTRGLIDTNWDLWLELNAQRLSVGRSVWEVKHLVEFFRQCVTPRQLVAEMDANDYYDLELARRVSCPVRVEFRSGVGFNNSSDFATYVAAFRNAELVQLPGDCVMPMFGGNSAVQERGLEEFLGSPVSDVAPSVLGREAPTTSASGDVLDATLSPRESEVLRLLASGHTNSEMAGLLTVSRSTVDRHVANIYAKLRVRNRSEATRWALTHSAASGTSNSG
jgi:DNA-binding CsgD family transcriptional regulator